MILRTRLLLDAAALLALLALPSALLAQEAGAGRADPQQATPERPAAESEPGAPINPGEPSDPGARGDSAEPAVEPAPESLDGSELGPAEVAKMRREVVAKMRAGEVLHRERLAAIHRLQQLAEAQGQAERLALLDKLEVKQGALHQNAAQSAAAHLGAGYKQSLMKLAAGRIRRNVPNEQPASTMTPEERAAQQRAKKAAKQAEGAASTKPADKSAEKPRGGGSS